MPEARCPLSAFAPHLLRQEFSQTSLVKAKCFPDFDQMWLSASVERLVICFASPPAIGINQICCEPAREERNAMLLLSGDQRGLLSPFS
jgi:hypothetical protein